MEKKEFDYIKLVVARKTLLAYLDFNKQFDIHMDADDYQLGAIMIQEGKPITLYRRKLTNLQTQYHVTEK